MTRCGNCGWADEMMAISKIDLRWIGLSGDTEAVHIGGQWYHGVHTTEPADGCPACGSTAQYVFGRCNRCAYGLTEVMFNHQFYDVLGRTMSVVAVKISGTIVHAGFKEMDQNQNDAILPFKDMLCSECYVELVAEREGKRCPHCDNLTPW
jgi:hypothetical protein